MNTRQHPADSPSDDLPRSQSEDSSTAGHEHRLHACLGHCLPGLVIGGLLGSIASVNGAQESAGAAVQVASSARMFEWKPFLAPFHAVVLHFPIGFLTTAVILEIYRLFRPSEEIKRITTLVIWLSLVSGIASATLGIMRAGTGGYEIHALDRHRWFGLAVPLCTFLTLAVQKAAYRNQARRMMSLSYCASLSLSFVLLIMAGHYGGNLTHGSHYLVENAPEFFRELLEPEAGPEVGAASDNANETSRYFTGKIKPILDAKCIKCHGPEKQKGDYRLDQARFALKGGESGKVAIVPGDPAAGNLVRLILLPSDHSDVMPPEGKEPLTMDEINLVIDWIRQGAAFPEGTAAPAGGTAVVP